MTHAEVEASARAAIDRLHAAMAKVANGDVSEIKALYSHSADATSFYGWGGYEKGWQAVSQRWDWAGVQFKGGTVRYENVSTVITPDMFCVTDIETFENQRVADTDGYHRVVQSGDTYFSPRGRRMASASPPRQPVGIAIPAIDQALEVNAASGVSGAKWRHEQRVGTVGAGVD